MSARTRTRSGIREVREVWQSQPTVEGAGVHLKRAFGFAQVPKLDPFLMLDAFGSDRPADYLAGFPWHPHRGIETITYMLAGEVEHEDSLGNKGVLLGGDVQWMTAGSGILHQEMPRGDAAGRNAGFQLWANLPAREKMIEPRYRDLRRGDVPTALADGGATVRVVAGSVAGVRGAVEGIVTDPMLADVAVPAGASFTHAVAPGHTVFAYVFEGEGSFDPDRTVGVGSLVVWGDGEAVTVSTGEKPVRFLLASGRPLGEPVAWGGPVVMNTQDELRTAFRELQQGTFVKSRG
jgi:redox-sensitive bicupin YhaK (pirin superfamily)